MKERCMRVKGYGVEVERVCEVISLDFKSLLMMSCGKAFGRD